MKNFSISKKIIIFIILFIKSINTRVFFAPSVDNWKQYTSQWDYDLAEYKKNRKYKYLFNIGSSFNSSTTFQSWCNDLNYDTQIKQDLAGLFHGASLFLYSDFRDLEDGAKNYVILPSYRLNQNTCSIDFQLSKDFNYCDKDIRTTVRLIVPFVSNYILNNNSSQMYYNYGTYSKNINLKENKNKFYKEDKKEISPEFYLDNDIYLENKYRKIKGATSSINRINKSTEATNTFIRVNNDNTKDLAVNVENGNPVFAVRASAINSLSVPIIDFEDYASLDNKFMVLNKWLPNLNTTQSGIEGSLNIEMIENSYGMARKEIDGSLYFGKMVLDNASQNTVNFYFPDNTTQIMTVQNNNPLNTSNIGVWPSLLSYTQYSEDSLDNTRMQPISPVNTNLTDVYQEEIFNLLLSNVPNYAADLINGDIIPTSNICYQNSFNNNLSASTINNNDIVRLVATGNNNSDYYNLANVSFSYSPVIFQKTQNGEFPLVFGKSVTLPSQNYNSNLTNSQFIDYPTYLNSLNNNDVTLLKTDGSFLNENASSAVFWYGWDYSKTFSSEENASNLNNLFMTTALGVDGKPTYASGQVVNTAASQADCCNVLQVEVDLLKNNNKVFAEELINIINAINTLNDNILYIYDTVLFQSTLNGIQAQAPETVSVRNEVGSIIDNISTVSKNLEKFMNLGRFKGLNSDLNLTRTSSQNINYSNGIASQMQYNEFQQSGLGDILLEFLLGTYSFNDRLISEILLGFQLPTSKNMNSSDSYFAIPLGNNGHYSLKFGGQLGYDIPSKIKSRINSKFYIEHAFNNYEQMIPGIEGKPIFGFIPLKMDTNVSWNAGLFLIEGLLFATNFTNISLGYQFWKKGNDSIKMINNVPIILNDATDYSNVNFNGACRVSERNAQTLYGTITSRLTSDFIISLGISNTIAGKNTAQIMEYFFTTAIDF